jgi:hypothetical protein
MILFRKLLKLKTYAKPAALRPLSTQKGFAKTCNA